MNTICKGWPKVKRELASIFVLSLFQIWLNFNFPPFVRLGVPWSFIVGLILSIVTTCGCIFLLLYPDVYASRFTMNYFNDAPEPFASTLSNALKVGFMMLMLIAMFVFWYTDFYGMSNIWYALLYTYWLLIYILIAKAVNRAKKNSS